MGNELQDALLEMGGSGERNPGEEPKAQGLAVLADRNRSLQIARGDLGAPAEAGINQGDLTDMILGPPGERLHLFGPALPPVPPGVIPVGPPRMSLGVKGDLSGSLLEPSL